MPSNLLPSARNGVVGVIDPDAYAAGTYTSGWIDMQDFFSVMGIVLVGDMVATSTVDAKFQQATSVGGAGAKDVAGAAITQLTQSGTDDNKQAVINLSQGDLDFNNGFRWVRLSMTVAAAASDAGAVVIGFDNRYGGANTVDASTVDEVVA